MVFSFLGLGFDGGGGGGSGGRDLRRWDHSSSSLFRFLGFFLVVLVLVSRLEAGILTIQDNGPDEAAPTNVFYYRIESNESIPQAIFNLPTGSWSFPTEDEALCVSDDPAACPITEISITNWLVFFFLLDIFFLPFFWKKIDFCFLK